MDDRIEETQGGNKIEEPQEEEGPLSDDVFEDDLDIDDMLDRLENNDPRLSNVKIDAQNNVHNIAWFNRQHSFERLVTAIGRNAQLKALMFNGWGINEALAVNFLRGIACNQSIKRIHFRPFEQYDLGNACHILTPLFKNNQVERIHIGDCHLKPECIRFLATSLAGFDSLKEFALTHTRIQLSDLTSSIIQNDPDSQQVARDLVQSLSGHSGLRKLDLSFTQVGKLGCSKLVDLLRNPSIKLRVLDLSFNSLGDTEAEFLASGVAGNTTLTEINLSNNRGITQAGWQALFGTLNHSDCRLERLKLAQNDINDAAAQSLSSALASNTTILKILDLGYIRGVTLTGWRVLFDFLRSQTCALENLDLRQNQLNDEVVDSLTDALASNRSLMDLNLSYNRRVTGPGVEVTGAAWQRFFSTVLANPSSGLESLDLADSAEINDAAIRALTNALVNNSKLKMLDLNGNNQITSAGWMEFTSVLESPHTALETLDLQGNELDNDTATLLVNSLAGNKKLKNLYLDHRGDWSPPLSVLCNTTSIMSTYNSNHTLEMLGDENEGLHVEFVSLLQINEEYTPSQAARLKIIKTHFKEGFNTHPFVDIDLNLLPHAMTWMIRDSVSEVNGRFYSFIRSISSLFENAHAHDSRNKRKRGE